MYFFSLSLNFTTKKDPEKFIDVGIDKWGNLLIQTELY